MEHKDNARNNVGRMANHGLSIKSKAKQSIVILYVIIK